ncbi:MAG: AlwI family type II restriction endonuclease [Kiritimatiellae bacterium]|nr:AlwI family type II restriction endonuclease [Kiritimatiellia bacterium]
MAQIKSPTLFFVTSPRTPFKMRPEIALLTNEFAGEEWKGNTELQAAFMRRLATLPEFEGAISQKDPALSARDRITRGPKALGLVALDQIALTPAGENFLDDALADEALLRQLLKFQLPSPFHKANARVDATFWVKPYLEILRLVSVLGRLAFDELALFGMQLTDWHRFDEIVEDVRRFRIEKEKHKGQYKKFLYETKRRVIMAAFAKEIATGRTRTRESSDATLDNFVKTKAHNLRDYADACLRYFRATGLVTISNPGRTISIIESRREEVAFILANIPRDPVFVDDEKRYCEYLYDAALPMLMTDDKTVLDDKAVKLRAVATKQEAKAASASELKKKIKQHLEVQKRAIIESQITELKSFSKYDDVVDVFGGIMARDVYDPPLALEWNTWRAMTMLDGGTIAANLNFDDAGNPLSTAPGNAADIVCNYGDFIVTVEVTLMSGNKQYDAEGEPVARHLGDIKAKTGKEAYCLFVAPTINDSSISHFYMLHQTKVKHYGGKSVIIPLTLKRFMGMLAQSKNCGYIPAPDKVRAFCEYSRTAAASADDETEWYSAISRKADNWLSENNAS